jgi:hypothetical protein
MAFVLRRCLAGNTGLTYYSTDMDADDENRRFILCSSPPLDQPRSNKIFCIQKTKKNIKISRLHQKQKEKQIALPRISRSSDTGAAHDI